MLKKNLSAILCAVIGLFAFICSAFTYVGCENSAGAYTGFDIFSDEFKTAKDADISCAGIIPVVQVLILVVGGLMLVWGVLALLKGMGKLAQFPDAIAGVKTSVISKIMLAAMAVLNILQLVFIILFVADLNDLIDAYKLGFGSILALILAVGAFAADYIISKKAPAEEE